MDLDLRTIVSSAERFAGRFGVEAIFVALCIRVGLIDELGELTYKQLDQRSNGLANA
jgi:hypothetical protein